MVDVTPYIVGVLAILGAIWSYFVVPYIKAKHTTEEITAGMAKLESIIQIVEITVAAADQIGKHAGWSGNDKFAYVEARLNKLGYTISPEIKDIIEAEVLKLHNELTNE